MNMGLPQAVYADVLLNLPAPGRMVEFSPKFNPMAVKGVIVYPDNPFKLDFIMDQGEQEYLTEEALKAESRKMAEYFLASLTTPEKDIWVNLSPFEKERITTDHFGKTLMGQALLAQDYLLKQIMASAFYPERQLGKEFWQTIYKQAYDKYGTTDIQFSTFNKVWIVPDEAVVYKNEKMNAVFIVKSSLKVLLEKDYLAANKHKAQEMGLSGQGHVQTKEEIISAAVIKEIVIPALEKEVNAGKNFAQLRQVYQALILAKWFKQNLANHLLDKGYANRSKIDGVRGSDEHMTSKIYDQYLQAYRKGVYNFIHEDYDEVQQRTIPRKYFSGGIMGTVRVTEAGSMDGAMTAVSAMRTALLATVLLTMAPGGADAQQLRRAVSPGAGAQTTLTQNDVYQHVAAITAARNGGGNPFEAVRSFQLLRNTFNAEAASAAAAILRLAPAPNWDNTLDVGLSFPPPITISGVRNTITQAWNALMESRNVGSTTLRLEAAIYIWRHADQMASSGLADIAFDRGVWESLTSRGESNPTARAARYLAMAALIKLGKETRAFLGNRITGMDGVYESLTAASAVERLAAWTVLDGLRPGDLDNRFQRNLEAAINGSDPLIMPIAVGIAQKQGITALLPNFIDRLQRLAAERPQPQDAIALRNWHSRMQATMRQMGAMSIGNSEFLLENLRSLAGYLTAPGATDTVNSINIGLMYIAVQAGALSPGVFYEQVNGYRSMAGLPAVSMANASFGNAGSDIGRALVELRQGINAERNAQIVAVDGGPFYTPDLIRIFQETNDSDTMRAILTNITRSMQLGAYARENQWIQALRARFNGGDTPRAIKVAIIRNLAESGQVVPELAPGLIEFVARQSTSVGENINIGGNSLSNVIALVARILANSGRTDLEQMMADSTEANLSSTNNMASLRRAYSGARTQRGRAPQAAITGAAARVPMPSVGAAGAGGGGQWQNAEKLFLGLLRNERGVTTQGVVASIQSAYRAYRSPSDSFSGQEILRRIFSDPQFESSQSRIKMADVFAGLGDMGFEFLTGLLKSNYPDVDRHVLRLIRESRASQKEIAADAVVESLLHWLHRRTLQNSSSRETYVTLFGEIVQTARAIGEAPMNGAILAKLANASPEDHMVLTQFNRIRQEANFDVNALMGPYAQHLNVVLNPASTPPQVSAALRAIASLTQFPANAWHDMQSLTTSDHLQGVDHVTLVQAAARAATRILGPSVDAARHYTERKNMLLNQLQAIVDGATNPNRTNAMEIGRRFEALVRSFIDMEPQYAAPLVFEGIVSLSKIYPRYAEDQVQGQTYFALLRTVREWLMLSPGETRQAVLAYIMQDMENRYTTNRRYDHPILPFFVRSIAPEMMGDIRTPYTYDPQNLNRGTAEVGTVNFTNGQRLHNAIRIRTESMLRSAGMAGDVPQPTVQGEDVLLLLEDLHRNFNPGEQMAALAAVDRQLLPFVPALVSFHPSTIDGQTALMARMAQLRSAPGVEDARFHPDQIESLTPEQLVVAAAGWAQSGDPRVYRHMIRMLDNHHFLEVNPAAAGEIIRALGAWGNAEAIRPILDMIMKNQYYSTLIDFTRSHDHVLGSVGEEAILALARRAPAQARRIVADYKLEWDTQHGISGQAGSSYLRGLAGRLPRDRAMTAPGGIDLEQTTVITEGDGEIKTAYDNPAQLEQLMNAGGLIPVIQKVNPVALPTINLLLGLMASPTQTQQA